MSLPVALTIAGSDSGGGAGIQADLKTFHAFGVFGTSAITAITAQNTTGVRAVHAVPADVVQAQIDAVVEDFAVAAVKTGMLATRELVVTVAAAIRRARLANYVLDPVMVATSGDRLLDVAAQSAISSELLPLAALVTPNIDEAEILTGLQVRDEAAMREAGRWLVMNGARAALIKGGHLAGERAIDVLFDGTAFQRFERARIATRHTHGTGCTLSAAIAAGLAHGRSLDRAVADGLDFVHAAISSAPGLGHGHGPLDHFTAAPSRGS
ncbi:MAG TPA: bifunctional hydroxymethylpyrimidine kinase/phosphomethylpyrimidine kinase [Longimicrobiales bacterium]